jgi:hypothetical protein
MNEREKCQVTYTSDTRQMQWKWQKEWYPVSEPVMLRISNKHTDLWCVSYGIKLMSEKQDKINCRSARVITNDRTFNILQWSSATCHVMCLWIETYTAQQYKMAWKTRSTWQREQTCIGSPCNKHPRFMQLWPIWSLAIDLLPLNRTATHLHRWFHSSVQR